MSQDDSREGRPTDEEISPEPQKIPLYKLIVKQVDHKEPIVYEMANYGVLPGGMVITIYVYQEVGEHEVDVKETCLFPMMTIEYIRRENMPITPAGTLHAIN